MAPNVSGVPEGPPTGTPSRTKIDATKVRRTGEGPKSVSVAKASLHSVAGGLAISMF